MTRLLLATVMIVTFEPMLCLAFAQDRASPTNASCHPQAFCGEEAAAGGGGRLGSPNVGASRIEWSSGDWLVVSFQLHIDPPEDDEASWRRLWSVRRVDGRGDRREGERWASSPDCPAIETALGSLEDVRAPSIDIPGIGRDGRFTRVRSGAGIDYRMWTRHVRSSGLPWESIEMSSNVATPLADWIDETLAALEPCWTDEPPQTD